MIAIMSNEIASIFEDGQVLSLDERQALFQSGDPVRSVFLVIEGQIDLVRHARSGAPLILNQARSGSVVAEASVYAKRYHCDGIANRPSQARKISVALFRARLRDAPDVSDKWAERLAHALQDARMNSEIRSLKTVAERLDAWLGDSRALPSRGRLQELAFVLGVSREALYRELARRRA